MFKKWYILISMLQLFIEYQIIVIDPDMQTKLVIKDFINDQ